MTPRNKNIAEQIIKRAASGAAQRAAYAQHLLRAESIEQATFVHHANSLFAEFARHEARLSERDGAAAPVAWYALRYAISQHVISEQLSIIDSLLSPQERTVIRLLCLGAPYAKDITVDSIHGIHGDVDLSVAIETLLDHDLLPKELGPSRHLLVDGLAHLRQARKVFQDNAPSSIHDFNRLLMRLNCSAVAVADLKGLKAGITILKSRWLFVCGPTVITFLQALCDPEVHLEASHIRVGLAKAADWGFHHLAFLLLSLRASVGSQTVRSEIKLMLDRGSGSTDHLISAVVTSHVEAILRPEMIDDASLEKTSEDILGGVQLLASLRSVTQTSDVERIIDHVIAVYNHDDELCEWINWREVHTVLKFRKGQVSVKSAFVHYLMGQPFMLARFRAILFNEGKGAWISDVITIIEAAKGPKLNSIVGHVGELRGAAQRRFIMALLSPPTIARIMNSLQHNSRWIQFLHDTQVVRDEARISAVRIDLAQRALELNLIPREVANTITADELSHVRLAFLKYRQLEGVVRVDHKKLADDLLGAFEDKLHLAESLLLLIEKTKQGRLRTFQIPAAQVEGFMRTLATSIVKRLVLDGPNNLKLTISDSLRHGQLPNRFLAAFDGAVNSGRLAGQPRGYRRSPVTWSEEGAEAALGEAAKLLIQMRDYLIATIKEFNGDCLSVTPDTTFYFNLHKEVQSVFSCALNDAAALNPLKLVEQTVDAFIAVLEEQLSIARNALKQRLVSYQSTARSMLVAHLEGEGRAGASTVRRSIDVNMFGDSLTIELHNAVEEACQWIGITTASESAAPFKFTELVQLALLTHKPSGSGRLPVEAWVARLQSGQRIQPSSEFFLKGEMFELLEKLVRNLLSNAYKHSGLGARTRIEINLAVGQGRLSLRCINAISTRVVKKRRALLPEALRKLRKDLPSAAAEDENSGFQKMKLAWASAFSSKPDISARIDRQGRFVVIVRGKHNKGDIIDVEHTAS